MNKNKVYVKSNKGTKLELKNLEIIKQIEESEEIDLWIKQKISEIKNITFKNNVIDIEKKKIVSSIKLIKTNEYGKNKTPLIWEYYKNRGNMDVNYIIKKYTRENIIINYSNNPKTL